jgi:hypothetical protein
MPRTSGSSGPTITYLQHWWYKCLDYLEIVYANMYVDAAKSWLALPGAMYNLVQSLLEKFSASVFSPPDPSKSSFMFC